VEDQTCIPSPRAPTHGKGKAIASASGSGVGDEEEEETKNDGEGSNGDDDGEEEEESFDVEKIIPSSYVQMGTPIFRQPQSPEWTEKISYLGKTEAVREGRKENPRLMDREPNIDYRFHTSLQQDFYESVIIPKNKPVALSQWIDWTYMENKHDRIFDEVVATCEAKHMR
jgi:hypothetical protein